MAEMIEMWKKKHNPFGILYRWLLATVANELGLIPAYEFRVAFEEARKYGAKVILGDRPVQLKEFYDVDKLTHLYQELKKEFPTLTETIVNERDQYMSSMLLKTAVEHISVVAVVGKGHLRGIKKRSRQPVVMKDLLEVPSQKPAFSTVNVLKSLGSAVAGVAVISSICSLQEIVDRSLNFHRRLK